MSANILILPTWIDPTYEDLVLEGNSPVVSGQVTLLNITVPAGEKDYLFNVHVSADAEATFLVSVGGVLVKRLKTSTTVRSLDSGFGGGFKKVAPGTSIQVIVYLDEETGDSIPTFVHISGFKETSA